MGHPNQPVSDSALSWVISLCLAAAVLTVYGQTWSKDYDFVNVDDNDFVTANPHVQAGLTADGARWALTSTHAYLYQPTVWLSLQLDAELFGTSAPGFHRTNTLLHLLNTLLLFWLLKWTTGDLWPSAAVGALFAVHPFFVESVAWVAERKNVLSTFFWLLATASYAWYAKAPSVRRYLLLILMFGLGLITKPMLVTLPATLLLLDYWPLRRWLPDPSQPSRFAPASLTRLVLEKLPLFAMVVPLIFLTLHSQGKLVRSTDAFPMGIRIANALVSYVKYLEMTFWPAHLAVYYPHLGADLPRWQVWCSGVLLAALTAGLLWMGRKHRYLTVGWLWYLGTLVPLIGLVQVCNQALADHYIYVPLIGVFIVVAWGLGELCSKSSRAVAPVAVLSGAALIGCLAATWLQVQTWRDSEALWRHALTVTGSNKVAHSQLGLALAKKDQLSEAIAHFKQSLEIGPHPLTHTYMGQALATLGALDEAAKHLEIAAKLEREIAAPQQMATTQLTLGRVREQQGRHEEAVRHFTAAVQLDPDLSEARVSLAGALESAKDYSAAQQQYECLLQADPDSVPLRLDVGRMLRKQGKLADAVKLCDDVLQKNPESHEAWNNKGIALEELGQFSRAVLCHRRALELQPDQLTYLLNLAYSLHESGQKEEASARYHASFRLQPDWPQHMLAEAWVLATHPDAGRRNGALALRFAKIACQATNDQLPRGLDVLAAAYAELGQFGRALDCEQKALKMVSETAPPAVVQALNDRLGQYQRSQPYRELPRQDARP